MIIAKTIQMSFSKKLPMKNLSDYGTYTVVMTVLFITVMAIIDKIYKH